MDVKDTYEDYLYKFISFGHLGMPHDFLANAYDGLSIALLLHVIVDYFVKHAGFANAWASQEHDLIL